MNVQSPTRTAVDAAPQTIGDTGVSRSVLEAIALKTLFMGGEMSLFDLAAKTCLSLAVIDELFQFFRREQLCEVKGIARGAHVITLSGTGKERAASLLALSQYTGAAPVSLEQYTERVRAQSVQNIPVGPVNLKCAFARLVLANDLVDRLGTAVTSGTSIFLYGPSGTGKTTIACSIPSIYEDFVLIPHAIEIDGQIIAVFDPGVHQRAELPQDEDSDRRWVLCYRPRVVTGGELSAEMLDVQFNAASRFFTAPLQLKANNGVFVLDDFGRQRIRPEELLNRWMTPLDRRMDFLTLPGGKKFEIPFDVLVVFSTNLDPRTLADEAFLRRIPNKINIGYATPDQFAEIFERECLVRGLACDPQLAEYAAEFITGEMQQSLCPSHVGDVIDQIIWTATYRGIEPGLTREGIAQACRNYFLPVKT